MNMALGIPFGSFPQPQIKLPGPSLQERKPEPGTLIVQDSFVSLGGEDHGHTVVRSAREQGFTGPVFVPKTPVLTPSSTRLGPPPAKSQLAIMELTDKQLDKKQALAAIDSFAENAPTELLKDCTQTLQIASRSGASQTATNFSLGTSKARITEHLYNEFDRSRGGSSPGWGGVFGSPSGSTGPQPIVQNMATAFGLDVNKLNSSDRSVSAPEVAKLQQALADRVGKTHDNSKLLAQAKSDFHRAVVNYESGHNSVVISAGNQAEVAKKLEGDTGGRKLRLPDDFDRNVLDNADVTSVGATRWFEKDGQLKEVRANYSAKGSEVDIWASGSLTAPGQQKSQRASTFGTSFSGPKVAATMAQLHKNNPGLSSSQVERLMKQQLTHTLNTSAGDIQVLDYQRTTDYLANNRF